MSYLYLYIFAGCCSFYLFGMTYYDITNAFQELAASPAESAAHTAFNLGHTLGFVEVAFPFLVVAFCQLFEWLSEKGNFKRIVQKFKGVCDDSAS